uniref:Uncharacterized protein n=1 Tax=Amphimedon queenslandica TaxID=400682 RepID=A0A1X7TFD3_AMPQE
MEQLFQCPMCIFICSTPNEWLCHLRNAAHEQAFSVSCCFEDCSHNSPFATFAGLKSHVYRAHLKSDEVPQEDDSDICTRGNEDTLDYDAHTVLDESMLDADINHLLEVDSQQTKRESALFIMRLREVKRLSQSSVNDVICGCRTLFSHTMTRLHASIRQRLAETGSDADVTDIFEEIEDPFLGLDTTFLQEKYINKEFNVLVSAYI